MYYDVAVTNVPLYGHKNTDMWIEGTEQKIDLSSYSHQNLVKDAKKIYTGEKNIFNRRVLICVHEEERMKPDPSFLPCKQIRKYDIK